LRVFFIGKMTDNKTQVKFFNKIVLNYLFINIICVIFTAEMKIIDYDSRR